MNEKIISIYDIIDMPKTVEVVRCKDCVFWTEQYERPDPVGVCTKITKDGARYIPVRQLRLPGIDSSGGARFLTDPFFYCAAGKRKDEESEQ